MKIRPVAAGSFHTEGVMTKLLVAFRTFAKAPIKLHPSTTLLRGQQKSENEQHSNRKM
jgi:hypothetical protein